MKSVQTASIVKQGFSDNVKKSITEFLNHYKGNDKDAIIERNVALINQLLVSPVYTDIRNRTKNNRINRIVMLRNGEMGMFDDSDNIIINRIVLFYGEVNLTSFEIGRVEGNASIHEDKVFRYNKNMCISSAMVRVTFDFR